MGLLNYEGIVEHNRNDIGEVTIRREQPFGIPHIKGETLRDTLYGLGYVHGQDRLFAMHIKRRAAQGRLSEFGGESTLETDLFFRGVGINRTIKKVINNMDDETKDIIQTYVNGINDYVHSLPMLPIEFQILGESFEDWTLEDCISIELLLNLFLSLDFYYEPVKDVVREKYGNDLAEKIFASREQHLFEKTYTLDDEDLKQENIYKEFQQEELDLHAENLRNIHKIDKTELLENFIKMTQIELLEKNYSQMKGSNIWVVDGNLTETGKPILANDPHLDTSIPSFWYQAELLYTHNGQKKYTIGTTVAGMPVVCLGRTQYFAWGITNNMADATDLYIEQVDGDKYFHDGKWIEMKQREEVIKIGRSGQNKTVTIYETHHGPILPSLLDLQDMENPFKYKQQYSFCWGGHQVNNNFIQINYKVLLSDDLDTIIGNFRQMTDPLINIQYATVDGNIGHISTGRMPVRTDPLNIYPWDGTQHKNDWVSFYHGTQQPQVRNPKKHYLVNCNNKVASDNIINHITATTMTHARSYRVSNLLKEQIQKGKKFTVEDFKLMQQDRVDSYCLETKQYLDKLLENYPKYFSNDQKTQKLFKQMVEQIKNWNCDMQKTGEAAVGAAIFGIWEQRVLVKYFSKITDNEYFNHRVSMNLMFDSFFFSHIKDLSSGLRTNEFYCESKTNENRQDKCLYNVFEALKETIDIMDYFFPNKPINQWQWGNIVSHEFVQAPFSKTPLQPIFGVKRQGAGNRRTINVGGINLALNDYQSLYSANFRMVLDLSENGKSYYVQETGQSESIFSPHYTDQLDIMLKGEYIEMKFGHEQFEQGYQQELILRVKKPKNNQDL
ncbi:hypothetical protein PPERSA_01397 [Pseudocohnilembus persalinus]|uniref:Penicillin acylase family protein n=1 Tax=Pseudocohnilembus persalinus TaxID=266149 RepID=A0A0V0QH54_PSEPJ|nr:hypothetical protein PPERSA_01397 [Pseudocohnilembus persalinus]|eukprot:KRX01494.1 hypothetical protein PPERSA_01397 [Pseudocohnilembus persalinus]